MNSTRRRPAPPTTPDGLVRLDDHAFQQVVQEELRGAHRQNPPETSAALRSPQVIERFHHELVSLQRSVEGQLAARREDFRTLQYLLLPNGRAHIWVVWQAGARPDQGEWVPVDPNHPDARRSDAVFMEEKRRYAAARAKSIRFKVAVEATLLEVKYRRGQLAGVLHGTAVTEERNCLAERVRQLEQAIRRHRDDFPADTEPEPGDLALWDAISE